MVRTSAPTVGGSVKLCDSHGNKPFQNIRTNMKDAVVGPSGPDIPELGTTLKTHDLNGKLVKTNLSEIEGANDNIEALLQYNKI